MMINKNNIKIIELSFEMSFEMSFETSFETFIINLKSDRDRWNYMKFNLDSSDIVSYKRIEAIDGYKAIEDRNVLNLLDKGVYETILNNNRLAHSEHNIGSLGCYLSHIKCWSKFLNDSEYSKHKECSNNDYLLVLEDDASIPKTINKDLQNVLKELSNNNHQWDVLLLGNTSLWSQVKSSFSLPVKSSFSLANYQVTSPVFFTGLSSYVIRKSSIEKLLQKVYPIKYQIDWFFGFYSNDINVLRIEPFMINLSKFSKKSSIRHQELKVNCKKRNFKNSIYVLLICAICAVLVGVCIILML